MMNFLKSKRFLLYHLLTAMIIGGFLAFEDILEDEFSGVQGLIKLLLEFVEEVPVFFVVTLVISAISRKGVALLNSHFPWDQYPAKRFSYVLTMVFGLVIVFNLLLYGLSMIGFVVKEPGDPFKEYAGLASIMFFIATVMTFAYHEFDAFFGEKYLLKKRAKELEKENFITKYEVLRNQVNPHFLFNSLNVLSGLIYEDVKKSDQFIRKFSEVFRYVLELNDRDLTTLVKELKFLDSYLFLQKMRYGDNVTIALNIPSEQLGKELPPMSLQIAVENVFKHNQVGDDFPMTISLSVKNESLIVKNTYNPRVSKANSTGIGQSNLLRRYELLSSDDNGNLGLPQFYLEDEFYVVELPLIQEKSKHVAHSHH